MDRVHARVMWHVWPSGRIAPTPVTTSSAVTLDLLPSSERHSRTSPGSGGKRAHRTLVCSGALRQSFP
jgi:hypothetical protein